MRKLPYHLENPIDNVLIDLAEWVSPFFKKVRCTPNTITTLSVACTLFSMYLFQSGMYTVSGITSFIGYFFDCLDGHFARKYDMVTEFGDMYDHVSDMGKLALNIGMVASKVGSSFVYHFSVFFVLYMMCTIHLSYQESYYGKNDSKFLAPLKGLFGGVPEKMLKWTRYVGCGTFNAVYAMYLISFK